MKEEEKKESSKLRFIVRNAVEAWPTFESIDGHGIYTRADGKFKPSTKYECDITLGTYTGQFSAFQAKDKDYRNIAYGIKFKGKPGNIVVLLISITTVHPNDHRLNHYIDRVLRVVKMGVTVCAYGHLNAFEEGGTSFVDSEGFVSFEVQIHAIGNIFRPELTPKYKLEMYWAYNKVLHDRCSSYVTELQGELKKVIDKEDYWPRFHKFLSETSEVHKFTRKRITDLLYNTFHKKGIIGVRVDSDREGEVSDDVLGWLDYLVSDMVSDGFDIVLLKKGNLPNFVGYDGSFFELVGKASKQFKQAAKLQHSPIGVKDEFDSSNPEAALVVMKDMGYKMLQLCITTEFFRMYDISLAFNKKPPKGKGNSRETTKGKNPETSLQAEEVSQSVESDSELDVEVKVEKDEEESKTDSDLLESVRAASRDIETKHKALYMEFEERVEGICKIHGVIEVGAYLKRDLSKIYTNTGENVYQMYAEKYNIDCNVGKPWARIRTARVKKQEKSEKLEDDARKVGRLGEKLAKEHLMKNWVRNTDLDLHWHNEEKESYLPYDITIYKKNKQVHQRFEVKVTRVSERYWFPISGKEYDHAAELGERFSLVFLKVKQDSSIDVFEIRNPAKNPDLIQLVFRTKREASGLISNEMTSKEVENIIGQAEAHFLVSNLPQEG